MSALDRHAPPGCPFCGEPVDVYVDPGGGERQSYIEDCAVCCRPIQLEASYDAESGEYLLVASPAQ